MELIRWLLAVHASPQQRGRVAAAKLSGVVQCRRRSGCLCHAPQHCCHPPGTRQGSVHAPRQVDIEQRCDPMGPFVTWEPAVSRMHATSRSKSCTRMPWMTVDKTVVLILRAVDTLDESMEPESCRHLRMQNVVHLRSCGYVVRSSVVHFDACALSARIYGDGLRGGALKPGTSTTSVLEEGPLCATLRRCHSGHLKTIRATRPCSEDWRIGERPSQLHGQPKHRP